MKLGFINQYKGLRKELYVLFLGRMMTNLGSMVWPVITLILSQKLAWDAFTISIALLIFSFVSLPIGLLGGKLADKFNKRNIIVICDTISIIGYIVCFFLPVNLTSIIIFSFAALFQHMEYASYEALVADFTTSKDRERAYSLSYLGSNLGLVLAPTLAGLLLNNYLNLMFLINGIAIAISTILIFFFIKDVHKEKDTSSEAEYEKGIGERENTLRFIFKNKCILLFIIMSAFAALVYNMVSYLVPLDLVQIYGEQGSVIYGTLNSTNCIVVVVCTVFVTKLLFKTTEVKKMIIGESLILIGYVFLVALTHITAFCYVGIFIFTIGEIASTISSSPYVTKRIPSTHRGRILSISNVINSLVAGSLQLAIGYLYDSCNNRYITWSVIGVIGVGVIILLFVIKKLDYKYYRNLYYGITIDKNHTLSIKTITKPLLKEYYSNLNQDSFNNEWFNDYYLSISNDSTKRNLMIMYDGTPIGLIGLDHVDKTTNVGYLYIEFNNKDYLNKGYELEALKILLRYSFGKYNINTIYFDNNNNFKIDDLVNIGFSQINNENNAVLYGISKEIS